jgi:hypothetical protein
MISERAAEHARELRALLADGTLRRIGAVDLGGGVKLRLDHAVRIVLGDLDDVVVQAQAGREVDADRWEQLGEDLAYLHGLARPGQSP